MQNSQTAAKSHLQREMGKDGVPVVVELLACQAYRTTAMQVHFTFAEPSALHLVRHCAKVTDAVMQLLVVVDAEAGRHLLSEALDNPYMSEAANSKCLLR